MTELISLISILTRHELNDIKNQAQSKFNSEAPKHVLLALHGSQSDYLYASWENINTVAQNFGIQVEVDTAGSNAKVPAIYRQFPIPCMVFVPASSWLTVSMNQVEVIHNPEWIIPTGAQNSSLSWVVSESAQWLCYVYNKISQKVEEGSTVLILFNQRGNEKHPSSWGRFGLWSALTLTQRNFRSELSWVVMEITGSFQRSGERRLVALQVSCFFYRLVQKD